MSGNPETKRALATLGGIVLAASLLLAACAPATAPTAEQNVVEIANIAPLTGPAADSAQHGFQGIQDYLNYFNESQGIPGVSVQMLWSDDGLDLSRFISAYRRFVESGVMVFYSDDTISIRSAMPQIEKNETPFLTGTAMGYMIYPPSWSYCPSGTYGEVSTAVLDYFMDNWKEQRPARVVYFGPEGELGRKSAEEAAKYIESTGMHMETLPFEQTGYVVIDATPQLVRIKDQGADLVVIQNIVPAAGPILKDAQRLGLVGQVQFAGFEFNLGETLIEMAGTAVEGYLAPKTVPWFDELDIPGMALIREVQMKYHGKPLREPEYMNGWTGAATMCEAIRRVIDDVGYENLTGAALKTTLDDMRGFRIDGVKTVSYGPEQRRASRMVATYQVRGGKIVRVSDWHESPILVP